MLCKVKTGALGLYLVRSRLMQHGIALTEILTQEDFPSA
jgi:hypothetical protein